VALRGGIDNLGWPNVIKPNILTYYCPLLHIVLLPALLSDIPDRLEGLWAHNSGHNLAVSSSSTQTSPQEWQRSTAEESQEYLSHPFPPELCAMISKFPDGFRELSLKCALRPSVIRLLSRVNDWITDTSVKARDELEICRARYISRCTELLARENLNVAERMVCNGLITPSMNVISMNAVRGVRGDSNAWYNRHSELEAKRLLGLTTDDGLEKDCFMWVAIAVAASVEEGAARDDMRIQLFEHVLEKCEEAHDWKILRMRLTKFFWNEACEVEWHACWKDVMQRRLGGLG
jgi:hypothetical protein